MDFILEEGKKQLNYFQGPKLSKTIRFGADADIYMANK